MKNELITGKTFGERGAGGIYGERPGICHIICCSYIHVIQLLLYSGYSALIHKLSTNIALVALVLCSYSPLNNKIVKKYYSSTSHIYSALIYLFCFNYKNFQKIFFLYKSYLFWSYLLILLLLKIRSKNIPLIQDLFCSYFCLILLLLEKVIKK